MTLHTLEEALTNAVRTYSPADAVCSLGDAYCPLADLGAWITVLPAAYRAERCFALGIGNVTDLTTGSIVSYYVTVEMAPPHTAVSPDGDARIKRDMMTFLLAVQSRGFLQDALGWNTMRRLHPVALVSDGDGKRRSL